MIKNILPSAAKLCLSAALVPRRSLRYFASFDNKKYKDARTKLATDSASLNAATAIRLSHFLQFKGEGRQQALSKEQLDVIVDKSRGEVSMLSHADICLLLEVLHQAEEFREYRRHGLLANLSRRISNAHTLVLEPRYTFRLLHILIQMRFPPTPVSKYAQAALQQMDKILASKDPISQVDSLRFLISLVELPYIPVSVFRECAQKILQKQTFQLPHQLCLLHYLLTHSEAALKQKISHFEQKMKVHDLLFNPFNEPDFEEEKQKAGEKKSHSMQEEVTQLLAGLKARVDQTKLKQELRRVYGFEKYPITPSTAPFLAEVEGLEDTLSSYCLANFKELSPKQLLLLGRIMRPDHREEVLRKYEQQMGQYLELGDKLHLLKFEWRYCGCALTKGKVEKALGGVSRITPAEFSQIGELISEGLTREEQKEIIEIVDEIVERM